MNERQENKSCSQIWFFWWMKSNLGNVVRCCCHFGLRQCTAVVFQNCTWQHSCVAFFIFIRAMMIMDGDICSWWFQSWLKDTFISMAPPMFVHSSIAVLITRLLFWPNLFQLDGRRSIFLFFRITKNCSLQILCCFTAWEFTFQTPVFSFRFTGFLDFLDLSVSAQIFATNNRFCSLEHRYRRKNWCREITEFCVVETSFENFFQILQDHRFFQILRS